MISNLEVGVNVWTAHAPKDRPQFTRTPICNTVTPWKGKVVSVVDAGEVILEENGSRFSVPSVLCHLNRDEAMKQHIEWLRHISNLFAAEADRLSANGIST